VTDLPPSRFYTEKPERRLREVDTAAAARRVKAFVLAVMGGSGLGGVVGWRYSLDHGSPVLYIAIGAAMAVAVIFGITTLLSEGSGAAAGALHAPSGKSTPAKREYSQAEALTARGEYDRAVALLETSVADYPSDPEPYLKLARLHRDQLGDYEQAVQWFRRARAEADIGSRRELLATQEIIEVYTHKLREPRRALPELARLADRFPDSPAAAAARRELHVLRQEMRDSFESSD
jgi:hypothetical protein